MMFFIENRNGIKIALTDFGGRIMELWVPDRNGSRANVVLGFSNENDYRKENPYFGCITGRVANRISQGKFILDGKNYQISLNDGLNALHGGKRGFDKVVWKGKNFATELGTGVEFFYLSPDGDEGFPGDLSCTVKYFLTHANELEISYLAKTTKPTPVNLTNHSYFNLAGAGTSDILGHKLRISSKTVTEVNETLIPTGRIIPVIGTEFDFTSLRTIGEKLPQGGFDHNFVLEGKPSVELMDPQSGRKLTLTTNKPGLQFYSGNFLDGTIQGNGGVYLKHGALCLEPQHFPDFVNEKSFPQMILQPGQLYEYTDTYKFEAE